MVKTEEKLKKEVGQLYLFANLSLFENNTLFKIVAFNDIANDSYEISIKADIVKIVKL